MPEATVSDLTWLLPLCYLQSELVSGEAVPEVAGLALDSLIGLHRSSLAAVWLWDVQPSFYLVAGRVADERRPDLLRRLKAALTAEANRHGLTVSPPEPVVRTAGPELPVLDSLDPYWATPVQVPGGVAGCVLVAGKPPTVDERARRLGHTIVVDALAAAWQRTRLTRDISIQAANALAQAVDAKDHYTHYHSRSVARLSEIVARRLGLSPAEIERTKLAGLLHDLGKIGIPDVILNKPGPLDPLETLQMRQHPVLGEKILATMETLGNLGPLVRAHHERWDGQGYPDRLQGEAIPLPARIIAVVDAYDAMTSDRPYRPSLGIETAAEELLRHRGRQFDPHVVDAFVSYVRERAAELHGGARDQWSRPVA